MSQKHLVALLVEEFSNFEKQSKDLTKDTDRMEKIQKAFECNLDQVEALINKPLKVDLNPFEKSKQIYLGEVAAVNQEFKNQVEKAITQVKDNKINYRLYLVVILIIFCSMLFIIFYKSRSEAKVYDEMIEATSELERQNLFIKEYPQVEKLYNKWRSEQVN